MVVYQQPFLSQYTNMSNSKESNLENFLNFMAIQHWGKFAQATLMLTASNPLSKNYKQKLHCNSISNFAYDVFVGAEGFSKTMAFGILSKPNWQTNFVGQLKTHLLIIHVHRLYLRRLCANPAAIDWRSFPVQVPLASHPFQFPIRLSRVSRTIKVYSNGK